MNSFRSFLAVGGALAALSIALTLCFLLLLAYPFMWLWNAAIVPVTGLATLTYWRSVGFLLLAFIIKLVVSGVKLSGSTD